LVFEFTYNLIGTLGRESLIWNYALKNQMPFTDDFVFYVFFPPALPHFITTGQVSLLHL